MNCKVYSPGAAVAVAVAVAAAAAATAAVQFAVALESVAKLGHSCSTFRECNVRVTQRVSSELKRGGWGEGCDSI